MIQNQPFGWTICAFLMAVNAGAFVLLSSDHLFGKEQALHSCEQNLQISRTLLTRLPAQASAYAGEALFDARETGPSYMTLALKESATAALRRGRASEAKLSAQKAIQSCCQWQSNCTADQRSLVSMHLADCERLSAIACWQLGDKQGAIAALDRGVSQCLSVLSVANRDSMCVKLGELSKLESRMSRKVPAADADKKDAVAAMLLNAPVTASVSAIKEGLTTPPERELWTALRTGSSIAEMIRQGRLSKVETYLQQLKQFGDEEGRCVNYDVATASAIDACDKQKRYGDAARLSMALADRFATSYRDCVASAGARCKAVTYLLAAGDFRNANIQFKQLATSLAESPNAGERWRYLCSKAISLSVEMAVREKLSGVALLDTLGPLRLSLVRFSGNDEATAAYDSLLRSGLQTAIMNEDFRDWRRYGVLSLQQIADSYAVVAKRCLDERKLPLATRALRECVSIRRRTGVKPSPGLIGEIDEAAAKLMAERRCLEASEILNCLDAVHGVNLYRAVRQSVCLFVLRGSAAGEQAQSEALRLAKNARERSLAQQSFLDLLQEHFARENQVAGLRSLCARYDPSLNAVQVAWGAESDQYGAALLQCASLHEKLSDFRSATNYLNRCTDALKSSSDKQLLEVLRAHRKNCAIHLREQTQSPGAERPR